MRIKAESCSFPTMYVTFLYLQPIKSNKLRKLIPGFYPHTVAAQAKCSVTQDLADRQQDTFVHTQNITLTTSYLNGRTNLVKHEFNWGGGGIIAQTVCSVIASQTAAPGSILPKVFLSKTSLGFSAEYSEKIDLMLQRLIDGPCQRQVDRGMIMSIEPIQFRLVARQYNQNMLSQVVPILIGSGI